MASSPAPTRDRARYSSARRRFDSAARSTVARSSDMLGGPAGANTETLQLATDAPGSRQRSDKATTAASPLRTLLALLRGEGQEMLPNDRARRRSNVRKVDC